jgi:RNA polymerase sigma factor (sigma-70 family)
MTPSIAFDRSFALHYETLIHWAKRVVPHGLGEPEDFVHLAYLRCRQTWRPVRKSACCEAAYFRRSIRWLVLDAVRQRQRRALHSRRYAEISPQFATTSDWPASFVEEVMTRMPRRQREIGRALVGGKSLGEIQREMGLSPKALTVGVSRFRRLLVQTMQGEG